MRKFTIKYSHENDLISLNFIIKDGRCYIDLSNLASLISKLRGKNKITYRVQNVKGLKAFKSNERHFQKFENKNFMVWSRALFWIRGRIGRFDDSDPYFYLMYWLNQKVKFKSWNKELKI